MTTFEIYTDKGGFYRWRLVAANGEKVAASEGYATPAGATNSARMVSVWATGARIVDLT